ncbi:ATP-binding cassette domain-containing protein [Candidatus Omnitrophota bacterium]
MHIGKVKKLFGTKIIALFVSTIFLGFVLGIIEMVIGFAIQNFLVSYNLIATKVIPPVLSPFVAFPTAFLIGIAVVRLFFYFLHGFIPDFTFEAFCSRVRRLLSNALIGTDVEGEALSVAEVSHITTNLTPKVGNFISALCQMIAAFFLLITLLIGMLMISTRLTLIAFIAVFVMVLPTIFLKSAYQRFAGNYHKALQQFSLKILRDLRNIYFLRIVGTNQREVDSLHSKNSTIFSQYVRYALGISLNNTWPVFAGVLIVMFTIWGNSRVNYVQSGTLITFVYLLVRLPQSISQFARSFGHAQFSYPFLLNFLDHSEFLLAEKKSQDASAGHRHSGVPRSLSVKGLSVGRNGALIEGINLNVNKGNFLLIAGESGIGKTTLLMTILGIVPKIKGEIIWDGTSLEQWDRRAFRKHLGYSGTDPFLLDTTIKENLLYGVRDTAMAEQSMDKVLDMTSCSFVHELGDGLLHKLGEAGEGISAGQKQRLSLARALLSNPSILVLDEATANIDEATEEKIFRGIRSNYPDLTIIAVSHRDSLKKFATDFLYI